MAGQFDFQTSTSPLLAALTQAPAQAQEMRLREEQARRERLNNLLSNMTQASTAFRQIQAQQMQQQQAQSQMQGQQELQDLANEPPLAAALRPPIQQFGRGIGPIGPGGEAPTPIPSGTAQPTFGQTQQGASQSQRFDAALLQAAPEQATAALVKQKFPDEESLALKRLRMEQLQKNLATPDQPKFRTNPVTGFTQAYDKESKSFVDVPGQGAEARPTIDTLPEFKQKIFNFEVNQYAKDPVLTAGRESLSQASSLRALLKTDVGFATEAIKGLVARNVNQEKGVLTDRDNARASGNQAFVPRLTQLLDKWQTGKFSEQNRKELATVLDAIEKNAKLKFDRTHSSYKNRISKRLKLDPAEVEDYLRLNNDYSPETSSAPASGNLSPEQEAAQFLRGG